MNINRSFSVGLPFMKLSLNPSMQKHNGKAAKTCSVGSAWDEMNDKRRGRDKTIDRTLTENNVWLIGDTNIDMEAVVQAEVDRVTADRKEHGKRGLRKDVVSAVEMIEKPPMDIMTELTREEQIELLEISNEVFEDLIHEWAPEWKTQAAVIHFDEFGGKAPHTHRIVTMTARDEDGILTMNAKRDFNLNFFTFINKNYSKRMQERGIPVKECNLFKEMSVDEQMTHIDQHKEYGVDAVTFKKKRAKELGEEVKVLESNVGTLKEEQIELEQKNEALEKAKTVLEGNLGKLDKARRTYAYGLDEFDPDKWKIEEPGTLELASSYKKKTVIPFVNKLLKKLKNLTFTYNNCQIELQDCKTELKEFSMQLDKEINSRRFWKDKCNDLSQTITDLKGKVKELNLIKRVLGSEKVNEIINKGREIEDAEIRELERQRQHKKSRNRGMSL